ncbi:hypothetical protein EXIGLDRAFT_231278 [Exidia glandulosa HHB12029]|uniref:Uncharacterized protein n=1 Tax=Exidia glandulosa HHB12029 TaxID=1314781 RepID=A0A165E5I2_EXIGL|nr:hypothetical protein EXIGLDRAFT_231278 [Exidia glandulosa HHB12029]
MTMVRYLGLLLLGAIMVIFLSFGSPNSEGDFHAGIFWTFTPITQFAVFWTVEVILQTRIYALYGSRRLAIINGFMFAIEIGVMLVLWLFRPAVNCLDECASVVPFYWLPGSPTAGFML